MSVPSLRRGGVVGRGGRRGWCGLAALERARVMEGLG